MNPSPTPAEKVPLDGVWWCLHSHTKDGDVVKGAMAQGSGALHLLLVGGWLGFTSNATGQDPVSSQMDAEMCHDDLAF